MKASDFTSRDTQDEGSAYQLGSLKPHVHAWSQEQLAAAADVSIPTIKRLEAQDGPLGGRDDTGSKIRLALETAGVEFIDENGGGARRAPSQRPSG